MRCCFVVAPLHELEIVWSWWLTTAFWRQACRGMACKILWGNMSTNFVNPHETHEIHDNNPYAILFIFTSCTIGGKIQVIFIATFRRCWNRLFRKLIVFLVFLFSYCSAVDERMAHSLYCRFNCPRTRFWGDIRHGPRSTKVRFFADIYKLKLKDIVKNHLQE